MAQLRKMNRPVLSGGSLHRFRLSSTFCSSVRLKNKCKADFCLSQTFVKNVTICFPVNSSWSSHFLAIQMFLATCLRTGATMRHLLFWVVTKRTLVGVYRRFRTAYPSHQRSRVNCFTLKDGTEGLSRNVGNSHQHTLRRTQKSKGLIYKQWKPDFATVFEFRAVNGLEFLT